MGFLNTLFKSGSKNNVDDFSLVVTDIHSHIIPGIDDGCRSMDESVSMMKWLEAAGFKKAVATPHVQGDFFKNTPEIIFKGLEDIRQAAIDNNINLELQAAAEYLLCPEFEDLMNNSQLMTFGDNYLLVEMSYFAPYSKMADVFFELQASGYRIILAHPERYTYFHDDFSSYTKLKDREILFQMNTISLTGTYSPAVKRMAEKLIDNEMIDFLGTDLHNDSYVQQLRKSLKEKYLYKLVESGKLLNKLI